MTPDRFNLIATIIVAVLLIAAVTCAIIKLSVLVVFVSGLPQIAIIVVILCSAVLLWAKLKQLFKNFQELAK